MIVNMPKLKNDDGVVGWWPGKEDGQLIPVYATAVQRIKMKDHEDQHRKDLVDLFEEILEPALDKARSFQGEESSKTTECDPTCKKCKVALRAEIGLDDAVRKYRDEYTKRNKELDEEQYVTPPEIADDGQSARMVLSW